MSRLYDLMLLIDSSAPEDRQKAIVGEVEGLLNSGGTIAGSYDWGSRKIAFEIDHRPEATYQLFQFEGDNALLDKLNHNLKIMDGVLRFRIVRQGPGSPPVPPTPEPIRAPRPDESDGSRVAARAAADAPAEQDEPPAEAPAEPAPAEPAPAEPTAPAPADPAAPAAD
jgi:small subunit ribosomal protein S6